MVQCNICKRIFKTKKSYEQHKLAKHEGASRPLGSRRARRPRRIRNAGVRGSGFDVNPSRARTAPGGSITLTGEDRIGLFTALRDKDNYTSVPIIPGASVRLQNLAKAYQRIKWLACSVTITPQAPLTVSGGYVAGFIMDPDDRAVTAQQLTAAQGSTTRKWFESCVVHMPRKPDLLYTSSGEEPRFTVPANFWLITEGPPSQDISVVITMRWRVTLVTPTSEPTSDRSFTLEGQIIPKQNNYNLVYQLNSKNVEDFSKVVPQTLEEGTLHFWRVPTFVIEYSEGTGDTGSTQAHFLVYDPSDKKMYYSSGGHQIDKISWQGDVNIQVLVPCGTVCKYVGSGKACRAVALHSQESKSTVSETALEILVEKLLSKLLTSKKSETFLSPNSTRSSSPFMNELQEKVL